MPDFAFFGQGCRCERSAQLLELSSQLPRLKSQVARMALTDGTSASIRQFFNSEWATFSSAIAAIVGTNEREHVRNFCNIQLQLLQRTVSRISSKQN
jgi:hypothetical protein